MSRPTANHTTRLEARTEEIANPPGHMWAAWRQILESRAPDLIDMLWDEDAARIAEVVK